MRGKPGSPARPGEEEIRLGGLHVFGCNAACPVCGEEATGAVRTCENCGTPHHADCWEYAGKCALYACEPGVVRRPKERPEGLAGWFWHWLKPRPVTQSLTSQRILVIVCCVIAVLDLVAIGAYLSLVRSVEAEMAARTLAIGRR